MAMHGFGALDPADAKRLLAQLFSEPDSKGDKESESEPPETSPDRAVSDAEVRQDAGVRSGFVSQHRWQTQSERRCSGSER